VVTAVDVDALAREVARLRRAQTRHQERHVGLVPAGAERDLGGEGPLTLLGRVEALVDRLAVDAAGGEAIHRNAVPPDDAREPLGPDVHRGLGRVGGGDAGGLGQARNVDDTAAVAFASPASTPA
jgi:hypothetical protein